VMKKRNAGGGKRLVSVSNPNAESVMSSVGKTPTTAQVGEPHTTLDIWGGEPELPAFLDRRTERGERPTGASEASRGSAVQCSKITRQPIPSSSASHKCRNLRR
jgi:hypothetical protein